MLTEHMITGSAATPAFKRDVLDFARRGQAPRIELLRPAPRIKVLRVLAQLLVVESDLEIESVAIHALSGCADFRGTVTAETPSGSHSFRFVWDCSWRAVREGWYDDFQFPDQGRAAREFDWECFAEWVQVAPSSSLAAAS